MRKSIFLGVAFTFVILIGFSSTNSIGISTKSDLVGEKSSNSILGESRNTAATASSNATTLDPFIPRR